LKQLQLIQILRIKNWSLVVAVIARAERGRVNASRGGAWGREGPIELRAVWPQMQEERGC